MKVNIYLALLIIIISNLSCSKDESQQREYPRLLTNPVTNITQNTANFNGEIFELGSEEIIDHGFIWGQSNPFEAGWIKKSLGSISNTGKFELEIDTFLDEAITYSVKAYLVTKTYTVYGGVMDFKYLGKGFPEVTSFSSKDKIFTGDTVIIKGKNFSNTAKNNSIYFSKNVGIPFYTSDTLMKVVVPELNGLNDSTEVSVYVEVLGNRAKKSTKIKLVKLQLQSFSPSKFGSGDTVTLHFNYSLTNVKINTILISVDNKSDYSTCEVISSDNNDVKILIPFDLKSAINNLKIKIGTLDILYPNTITILPPVIYSFTPDTIDGTSRITVYGKYFVKRNTSLMVDYQSFNCDVLSSTKLQFDITNYNWGGIIKVTSLGQGGTSKYPLVFLKPILTGASSTDVFPGDTITIYGNNLLTPSRFTSCRFENISSKILHIYNDSIKVIVPEELRNNMKIYFHRDSFNYDWELPLYINCKSPIVTSVSSKEVRPGDIFYIKGKYFYKNTLVGTGLSYDNFKVTQLSSEELKVEVVSCLGGNKTLYIFSDVSQASIDNFKINSPYKIIDQQNTPGALSVGPHNYFYQYNNYMYFDNDYVHAWNDNLKQALYKFDIQNLKSTYIRDFNNNRNTTCFGINQNLYYLFEKGDQYFEKYDIETGNTTILNNFPGGVRSEAFTFTIGDKGYVGCGIDKKDLWEYDVATDKWAQKLNFSGSACKSPAVFVLGSKAYVINQNETWEYSPSDDSWTRKADYPGQTPRYSAVGVSYNGFGYVFAGDACSSRYSYDETEIYYKDVYRFDPINDVWKRGSDLPGLGGETGLWYIKDSKLYIGDFFNHTYGTLELFQYNPDLDIY